MMFSNLIEKGGTVMVPLIFLAILSVAIIADRISVALINRFSHKKNKPSLKSGINALELISQISPALGFLGTVTGIMSSFSQMSQADSINIALVAGGMYEALYTTAAGLIISIADSTTVQILRWKTEKDEDFGKI